MGTPFKSRARLVCVHCHERKIKCDLEESRDNTCAHCRRHKVTCVRREGVRKRSQPFIERRSQRQRSRTSSPAVESQPDLSYTLSETTPSRLEAAQVDPAYIAEHSVLQDADYESHLGLPSPDSPATEATGGVTPDLKFKILRATDAHKLPKPALKQALFDAFFTHLSYCYPIVERAELEAPGASVLLQQAVCLAGSMMRHPNLPDSSSRAQAIYEKIKILICVNHEPNMLVMLKVMSLLTVWSPVPSHIVSLDGPWHATGTALRLAVQMGMHRSATYNGKPDRGCRRRLWWLAYASDCVQALIYGRLPVLKPDDFDVAPLTEDDFEVADTAARNFIADTLLARIMGDLVSKIYRNTFDAKDKARVGESLSAWMADLPSDIRLYDEGGRRRPFCFPISELHMEYYGTVILSQAMSRQFSKQWPCSTACLLAATCIASLYEEVLYRDQVALFGAMHSFWCLTAAIPLMYYKPESPAMETQRRESLAVLTSVVEQLKPRYGVAQTVGHKIERLQRERRDILLQQTADQARGQAQGAAWQGEETQQLVALFPQLKPWSSPEAPELHNAIFEGIARTHVVQGAQEMEPPSRYGGEGPLSVFDALGASSFMDIFFDDLHPGPGDELGFEFNTPQL